MGFVFDYITSCGHNCNTFDATNAGWTKLAHAGIDMSKTISSGLRATMKDKPEQYYPTSGPGLWAMAKLGKSRFYRKLNSRGSSVLLVQDGSKWSKTP
jgi:hypothetical protein